MPTDDARLRSLELSVQDALLNVKRLFDQREEWRARLARGLEHDRARGKRHRTPESLTDEDRALLDSMSFDAYLDERRATSSFKKETERDVLAQIRIIQDVLRKSAFECPRKLKSLPGRFEALVETLLPSDPSGNRLSDDDDWVDPFLSEVRGLLEEAQEVLRDPSKESRLRLKSGDPASQDIDEPATLGGLQMVLVTTPALLTAPQEGVALRLSEVREVVGADESEVAVEANPRFLEPQDDAVNSDAASAVTGPQPNVGVPLNPERPAQGEPAALVTQADRRAAVNAFLSRCREETTLKAMKKHIWRAVGHKTPRQFQYWQAGTDRRPGETHGATKADDQNFRRILAMSPAEFVATLAKKGIT